MSTLIKGYLDRNLGDDLMLRIVLEQLKDYKFYIAEEQKELLLPFANINNIFDLDDYPNKQTNKILKVTGSDFMILNKTGIYYSLVRILQKKKNKKVPMAVIGCNVGPFVNSLARNLAIKEMEQYKLITVRDKFSYEFIKKNTKKPEVYYYPDLVFALPDEWLPNHREDEGHLGISAYRRAKTNNYKVYKKLAIIADRYIQKTNKKVLLFAFDMENENDISAAFTIKDLCKNKDKIEIILHNDNGDNIIKNMARCERIIGIRLHCSVLAIRMGKPFIPIIYSKKTHDLLDDLNYREKRFNIDNFEIDEVLETLYKSKTFKIDKDIIEAAKGHVKTYKKIFLQEGC